MLRVIGGALLALTLGSCASVVHDSSTRDLSGAIGRGDLPSVVGYLRDRADPNAPDEAGALPLVSAASWSSPEIVAALLVAGANPNRVSRGETMTPLLAAAMRDDKAGAAIATILLKSGADPCPRLVREPKPELAHGRFDGKAALEIARLVGNIDTQSALGPASSGCDWAAG